MYRVVGVCIFIASTMSCHVSSGTKLPSVSALQFNDTDRVLVNKVFFLFEKINNDNKLRLAVKEDIVLQKKAVEINDRYNQSLKECEDLKCLASALRISDSEIIDIEKALARLEKEELFYTSGHGTMKQHIPLLSGLRERLDPKTSWRKAAVAINHIYDVYLADTGARYRHIDGMSFSASDRNYFTRVKDELAAICNPVKTGLYFELPLLASLKLLEINGRNEAARYEPLSGGLNKKPFEKLSGISWDKYSYSFILVPGLAPRVAGVALDSGAARRCVQAVDRFRKGLAPFIVVSGGHVHPNKTPYNEAVEMKNYIVEKLKVPDEFVFIEPYARHTTTNIRNAVRLLYLFPFPANKPVMLVTDFFQTTFITMMQGRFMDELGYIPYRDLKKLTTGEIVFYPDASAMQVNPMDPLDP